jgi:predicted dinucleotide-binding enzyme
MTSTTPRKLGILGAGHLGQPIGRHWAAAGHAVVLGSRTPERLEPIVEPWGGAVRSASLADAADFGDVVLLCVPNPALDGLLADLGGRLAGKIVIDATNPVARTEEGRIVSALEPGLTQGRRTAKALPESAVIRAFTHVMYELVWPRGTRQPLSWGMALAGDDPAAKGVVAGLVADTGFAPVDIGGLDDSAPLEPGGVLFPRMYSPADLRAAVGL